MRPEIPSPLESRIDPDLLEQGGYKTAGDLIRDATRRRIEELEASQ